MDFPQIVAAPGMVAIVWNGLFERFRAARCPYTMKAHVELLFAPRSEKNENSRFADVAAIGATLAGCDNNNDPVLQGWVEAELILCRRTSRDVLKH